METQTTLLNEQATLPIFDWKSYNDSQTKEKSYFISLLNELCNLLRGNYLHSKEFINKKYGDMIFCMCLKVYSKTSSRRIISDLHFSNKSGYISYLPHFNSLLNYFNNKRLTPILKYLIKLSSLPLASIERRFAVDSTGIASKNYLQRWSYVKQDHKRYRDYKKVHAICGIYSNIITYARITDAFKHDSPQFKRLLEETAKNFNVEEILADMGYLSRENLQIADDLNITPYIPFKRNTTSRASGSRMWNRMYRFFKENPEEFGKHYHKRSNIESTFFMLKQKFGDFVYCKNSIAQENEIYCKILCHNLCILIQEIFLSKLNVEFDSTIKRIPAQLVED